LGRTRLRRQGAAGLKTAEPMVSFHRFPCFGTGFRQPVTVATSPSLRLALVKPGGIVELIDAA
jgi:hypothetical protein